MDGNSLTPSDNMSEKRNYYDYQQYHYPQQQYQQEAQHWMTPEISAQVQACSQLRKTAESTGKQEDHEAYQAQCRKVHKMIEESKLNLGLGQLPALPQGYGWNQQKGYGYNGYYPRGSNYQHSSGNYHQGSQKGRFECKPCNRSYFSKRKLDEHLEEHVDCPFPECKMSAHIKVIDQHINNQHMLVNFASLQIDDETWVAERKKRFPTAQRAELRRAEQIEKLKRGETLGITKKPFKSKIKSIVSNSDGKEDNKGFIKKKEYNKDQIDKVEKDYDKNNVQKDKEEKSTEHVCAGTAREEMKGNKGFKRKGERRERFKRQRQQHQFGNEPPVPVVEVDLFDSDDEMRDGLCTFKGTRSFYEEIGEVSYFGNKIMDESDDDDDGDDDDDDTPNQEEMIAISDDEEWEVEKKSESGAAPLLLGGALGSLMGAYSDSEDENVDESPACQEKDVPQSLPKVCNEDQSPEVNVKPAEEVSKNENDIQKSNTEMNTKPRRKMTHRKKFPPRGPRKARLAPRRRKTLLERLLQSDIIHERNIILQCVRFIVGNNFFYGSNNIDTNNEVDCEEVTINTEAGKKLEKKSSSDISKEVKRQEEEMDTGTTINMEEKSSSDMPRCQVENSKVEGQQVTEKIFKDIGESNPKGIETAKHLRRENMTSPTDTREKAGQVEVQENREKSRKRIIGANTKDESNKKAAKRLKKELLAGDDTCKNNIQENEDAVVKETIDTEQENGKLDEVEVIGDRCNTVLEKSGKENSDKEVNSKENEDPCTENQENSGDIDNGNNCKTEENLANDAQKNKNCESSNSADLKEHEVNKLNNTDELINAENR